MNEELRRNVKLIKIFQGVSYTKLAKEIGTTQSSFYAWLKGQYEFSDSRELLLRKVIQKYQEE